MCCPVLYVQETLGLWSKPRSVFLGPTHVQQGSWTTGSVVEIETIFIASLMAETSEASEHAAEPIEQRYSLDPRDAQEV